jgi:hypothetical protein
MTCTHTGNKTGRTGAEKHLMDWICDDCDKVIDIIDHRKDPIHMGLMARLDKFNLLEQIYINRTVKLAKDKKGLGDFESLEPELEAEIKRLAKEDYLNNPKLEHLRKADAQYRLTIP